MRRDTFVWLIGMTAAGDDELRHMAMGFGKPPKLEAKGATPVAAADFAFAQQQRRALCLTMDPAARSLELKLTPNAWCVNPVFELANAPRQLKRVSLNGKELDTTRYAWDGRTLWIKASLNQTADLRIKF